MSSDCSLAAPKLNLAIQYALATRGLPTRAQFRKWARAALTQDARVAIRIVGRTEGKKLNHTYRQRDYATNVLTFVLNETQPLVNAAHRRFPHPRPLSQRERGDTGSAPVREEILIADLVLCAPVVAAEARAQGKTAAAHYAHLTVHGLLHLQSYDHEKVRDARVMERLETRILAKLGYADPY